MIPLMHLFGVAESIDGRTKIQKMVYILQCMGFPFPEPYRYHLHGPYSENLTRELGQLADMGFLDVSVDDLGDDVKRFSYRSTDKLKEFLIEVPDTVPSTDQGIEFEAVVGELNGKPSSVLEAAATAVFLNRMGTSRPNLRQELLRRKPHLVRWIDPALEYLDTLSGRGWLKLR